MGDDEGEEETSQAYKSFLQSLDNSQFLSHVNTLSQNEPTQLQPENSQNSQSSRSSAISVTNVLGDKPISKNRNLISSDPFDDSFNEALLAQQAQSSFHDDPQLDEDDDLQNVAKIGPAHNFGEYGVYFENKHLKQQNNDLAYRLWDQERRQVQGEDTYKTPIFKNCIIHVNGHTVPSYNEIHRLVIIYGGKFLTYLGKKSAATHIVCDRLTPRKKIQFKNCRVVKAQWIVDCIEAGTLLDWQEYRLFLEIEFDQHRLDFTEKLSFVTKQQQEEDIPEEDANLLETEVSDFFRTNDRVDENGQSLTGSSIMDAKNPDFLKNFFANSRLHHLSSWKADLKIAFLKRILNSEFKPRTNSKDKYIMHIDFDCFFATASAQKHPNINIHSDPIAVSHGNNTSDVASCNYVARLYGVKNGTWIRLAKRLCPNLIIVGYEFDLYEKYASELYNYFIEKSSLFDTIFPVLIDEALLDITSFVNEADDKTVSINNLCKTIRSDIFERTGCSISIGVSKNVLLAKLALKKAKPDGYLYVSDGINEFLDDIPIRDFPGVGYSVVEKLTKEFSFPESPTIQMLRQLPKDRLMNAIGPKMGDKLYSYARGIDTTSLDMDKDTNPALLGRKSVSIDINFGIRFDTIQQVEVFLGQMGEEMSRRLKKLGLVGSQVNIKLAQRAEHAPVNPPKFLGMGICDFYNKSARLGVPTNEHGAITSEIKSLNRILGVPVKELRGIAVMVSRLEDAEEYKKNKQMKLPVGSITRTKKKDIIPPNTDHFVDPFDSPEIDWEVFNALPWDVRKEIKSEAARRGILIKGGSNSSLNATTPKKRSDKVYLQQLLPSGSGNAPQYVRVIESPKKSKIKSRNGLPQKISRSVTPMEEDVSYDSLVLENLPSSVREEVLEDLERRRENARNTDTKTNQQDLVNKEWLSVQKLINPPPKFLDTYYMFSDVRNMVEEWIRSSMDQEGPHIRDVHAFADYIEQLLHQRKLNRCLNLMDSLERELSYHESITAVTGDVTKKLSIKEWRRCIATEFQTVIDTYCQDASIKLHQTQ